ncbi:MAG: 2-C-methyl-D-erythritol 4-phosphate cytidylyltransferase [Desulfomonilia bacterium]|jgi:2-C-methyl-D-erythritol 4-phosphate cytidylyltransferase|uniref:2-C-methyl-D-erythritol 4-phosphate cytidylyltransferase n=1 Tax=anaerobic digester metagenome TaxID=1263854 RepID=A0A485M489_9ZZZZ|nr:2-C-methyl-D-erythritol 4-phosphate cytidylyltransferase [Pseudomonadota bacterium]HPX19710.1 2-C-methyl-D-erythritol 4-phosphate cytidylyltransferase [Deltaproteobacteria bacterium]
MAASAVIVAGGSGTRFGRKKQFLDLCGVPLIRRTVDVFASHEAVDTIIVAVPPEDIDLTRQILEGAASPVRVVQGGRTRQESVYNGLLNIAGAGTVLVHDAVRPLVTGELISRVLEGLGEGDACIPVLAVSNTLKEVREGVVVRTVPRSDLYEVQTPQAFPVLKILKAHTLARQRGILDATDDSAVIEQAGGVVRVVEGDPFNIKITVAKDLEIAEAMLTCRTGSV